MKQFLKKNKTVHHALLAFNITWYDSHTVCSTVRIPGQRTVSVWWRVSGITSYDNGCVSASTDCAGSP